MYKRTAFYIVLLEILLWYKVVTNRLGIIFKKKQF